MWKSLWMSFCVGCVAQQIPTCTNATGRVQELMCGDVNIAALWREQLIDDRHNAQFHYSRDELAAIAEYFPSDGVGQGPLPNEKQAAILKSILSVTDVLLNMMSSLPLPLKPWQLIRTTQLTSIFKRFNNRYQTYLSNPTTPLLNVIPKWYHGFYSDITESLKNGTVFPDKQPSGRNFSTIWWDHKPGAHYGPYWVSYDRRLEDRDLSFSFYPSVGDGNCSSWYIAFPPSPTIPLFTEQGKVNFVDWVVDSDHMQTFTTLLKQYLNVNEVETVLNATINSDEARLQDVIVKLSKVYSSDRANLITSITLQPTWGNYTETEQFEIAYNWCAAKICLSGAESAANMAASLNSLESGTILQTWGFTNEYTSRLQKFMLIVEQGDDNTLPVVADIQLDAQIGVTMNYPLHVPLKRQLSEHVVGVNSTHLPLSIFTMRGSGYSELGVPVVQVFGTIVNFTISDSVPDINQLIADGKWEHRLPKFPFERWSNDCGGQFCQSICEYQGPNGGCAFRNY